MYIPLYTIGFFRMRDQISFYCVTHMFLYLLQKHFQNQTMFEIKDSQDKTSVAFFYLLIFHYFLQLFFRLTPLSSSAKSKEKLVIQKYAALFLFWMPFIFWQFSLFNKFTMGSLKHFVFKFWQLIYILPRGSKLKR